ncbi:MAG: efflux RND transporter periplasmic adaptor subunit [Candidatus Binataceae bacterium]
MTRRRTIAVSIVAAVAMMAALVRVSSTRADEDEEKPITSSAAQISRDAAGHVVIAVRPAAQKEIGVTTETLAPVVRPVEVEGYGFILDPAPLSKLNSDLVSAQATLDASAAQFRRTKRLYAEQKNVSLRDLQTAEAAYLIDKARLETLGQQLRDTWGGEIARADSRSRSELVYALIDRREAIARVTVPAGKVLDDFPAEAKIAVLGHEEHPVTARAVYFAPTVDPRIQGQSFLLLMRATGFPIRPGMAVSAALPTSGSGEQGVMVPRSAVLRYAGKEWVYQGLDADRFTRREIVPAQYSSEGYFITQNLKPGMWVVVTGAQTLLSEELKAEIQPAD